MSYYHQPVLLKEVLEGLQVQANRNYIDGTLGGGGHAEAILEQSGPKGFLLALDRDESAIKASSQRLNRFRQRINLIRDSYKNIDKYARQGNNLQYHGALLDLGLSSYQISSEDNRGFSFQKQAELDMRFGLDSDLTAGEILNNWPQEELVRIFKEYGEEPRAKLIASNIVRQRQTESFKFTSQLVNVIQESFKNYHGKIHPATRVFQALRIAVNSELETLTEALPKLLEALSPGGRLAIISYHSLEDRLVKNFFQERSQNCICPKELPICKCNHKAELKIITKKPIIPTEEEVSDNPRSRSAKLRLAEKL